MTPNKTKNELAAASAFLGVIAFLLNQLLKCI
jgi:hypothetical protein